MKRPTNQQLKGMIAYLRQHFVEREKLLKEFVDSKDIPKCLQCFDDVIKELNLRIKEKK